METLPQGFLGTRADLFMDGMIVIVAAVPALLALTWALARRGAWRAHKGLQVLLTAVFAVVLLSFEAYIRYKGGVDGISVGSSVHQTDFLYGYLAVHLAFAISSAVLWGWLFWDEMPDQTGWLGIAIIIAAGLYVIRTEGRQAGTQGSAPALVAAEAEREDAHPPTPQMEKAAPEGAA